MTKKGEALEELVRHYFDRQGFFALRSVPYRFGGEGITDIDVWLYHRPAASARVRAVVDVKSRKSPKALERVLWTKGLQAALRCDKAIVATTDTSPSVARFGREQNVTVLTKSFLDRLEKNLEPANRLSLDELIESINRNSAHKQDGDWIKQLEASKSALVSLAGFAAFNRISPAFSFFAERAYTRPQFREQAIRCAFLCASLACIALDTALEQLAFEDLPNRTSAIQNGVAFGDSGDGRAKRAIDDVLAVIRESMDNGKVLEVQARESIMKRFEAVRADVVAEYFSREHNAASLFQVARELDREAHRLSPPSIQNLSNESKSALGVFLDFVGVQRTYLLKGTNGASDPPKTESATSNPAPKLL
jgi:hypothetical protein